MMQQVVGWTVAAMSAVALVLGCVEWIRGRGHHLALGGVPATAFAIYMLLGDGHAVWRYVCLAVVFVFSASTLIRLRKTIRWRSPMILSAASAILLIVITELAVDVVGGIPTGVAYVLLAAVAASTALFIGSTLWEVRRLARNRGAVA